jgi:Protein of unknown function (DUF3574)
MQSHPLADLAMQNLPRRLALTLLLSACAGSALADSEAPARRLELLHEARLCATALHGERLQRTELFFGRNSPAGEISEQAFQGFVDAVVTPLFPDGLTVIDGKGQFRASADSPVEKELSKVLVLLYRFDKAASDKVEEIRSRYKARFQQQSVLRVDEAVCVSF